MDCANRKVQLASKESHGVALLAGAGSNGDLELLSIILELPCLLVAYNALSGTKCGGSFGY
jgi:hypothetical protein